MSAAAYPTRVVREGVREGITIFPPAAFRRFRRAKAAPKLQFNAALEELPVQYPNKPRPVQPPKQTSTQRTPDARHSSLIQIPANILRSSFSKPIMPAW